VAQSNYNRAAFRGMQSKEGHMNRVYSDKELAREQAFQAIWSNDIPDVFRDVAKYYDKANVYATLGTIDGLRRRFVSTMKIEPKYRLLDVCAGTNVIGIELLKREPTLDAHAIDRSAEMQQVGQELAAKQGFKIKSTIKDVHELPFPDNHFDMVTLQYATRHIRAMQVFGEIRRVLKPGGYFYHCDMLRPANKLIEMAYYVYLRIIMELIPRAYGSGDAAMRCRDYFLDAVRLFYSTEELSKGLTELGFTEVEGRSVMFGTVGFHKARKPL
jgi:demethylmenaquinone methyltransferase/2-methoxy-6-polyprenyl-1,4-benzoquinol methylase